MSEPNPFFIEDPREKIRWLGHQREALLGPWPKIEIPKHPARNVEVVAPDSMPAKIGLSFAEGQARLLHDLASIELQAMELGIRELLEFPEANPSFREQLLQVTMEESEHLTLCLDAIESLGFRWGHWPVHDLLWQCVSAEDSLLDRIFIVHRYLEASGLDAGDAFIKRLKGVKSGVIHQTVQKILSDEINHVQFGTQWYHHYCQMQKLDPDQDFRERLFKLRHRLPKRIEVLSLRLRAQAGFLPVELSAITQFRESMVKFPKLVPLNLAPS